MLTIFVCTNLKTFYSIIYGYKGQSLEFLWSIKSKWLMSDWQIMQTGFQQRFHFKYYRKISTYVLRLRLSHDHTWDLSKSLECMAQSVGNSCRYVMWHIMSFMPPCWWIFCRIMDKHLKPLARKHIDTKFIKLDAEVSFHRHLRSFALIGSTIFIFWFHSFV